MKYNKVEIMTKAHSLRKNYNMSMSEALTKAWGLAKLENLNAELFELNMRDISGGANNIFAQNAIRANREAINAVQSKISVLQAVIFPTVVTERKIKLANPTIKVEFDKETKKYTETVIEYLTQTNEYLDINAYDKAA